MSFVIISLFVLIIVVVLVRYLMARYRENDYSYMARRPGETSDENLLRAMEEYTRRMKRNNRR